MSYENIEYEGQEIFVARQPIFDCHRNVFGYELLFRKGFHSYAAKVDTEYATVKVISNSLIIGLNKLTGGKLAFINFNRQLLMGNIPQLFPNNLLAVEILERVEPEQRIVDVCEKMKLDGYLLVLDDFVFDERFRPFMDIADIIKIDFLANTPQYRRTIIEKVHTQRVRFLAEKIETQEQFDEALDLGYQYFQGFFFQKPDVVRTREMPGYKFNYLQILKKLSDPDLPYDEVERILKHDVSLTYKLLRFINSAVYGFRVTIRSIRHALVLLGKREIRKWLTLIALSGIGSDKPLELLHNTLVRARFCELIGQDLKKKNQSDQDTESAGHTDLADFFLVGMFSVADAFLDRTMADILEELPLDVLIKDALLGKKGVLKDVLDIVVAYERADWQEVARLSVLLQLPQANLVNHYIESVNWVRDF